ALSLCFSGGGDYANGRFMFDADGNLWSGMNWMPGSQSGVNKSTGGGVIKFSPSGVALSPPITGFTGMGIDGGGWGTAVTKDRVWISSFNGKILVMDFNGKPVATENDLPFKEKFLGLMGIGVSASGDVWIADGSDNQLLFFPGGSIKDGRIVKVAGLNFALRHCHRRPEPCLGRQLIVGYRRAVSLQRPVQDGDFPRRH